MNTERLTTKSRDAVTAAVRQALTNGNPNAEPAHLLHGLLLTPDNTVGALLEAVGSDPAAVDAAAVAAIKKLPATSGSSVSQPGISGPLARVLAQAETLADSLGDMRQRFIDLVDEDQAEVSGAQLGERRVDGQELAAYFLDVFCPPGVL